VLTDYFLFTMLSFPRLGGAGVFPSTVHRLLSMGFAFRSSNSESLLLNYTRILKWSQAFLNSRNKMRSVSGETRARWSMRQPTTQMMC
jgi:hypothetical protein